MNDAGRFRGCFRKKRRRSGPGQSAEEGRSSAVKSLQSDVSSELIDPFYRSGDTQEADDYCFDEGIHCPVFCYSPGNEDQRRRFCELFALALRGSPIHQREPSLNVNAEVQEEQDGAVSDADDSHQSLRSDLEEELFRLCEQTDQEDELNSVNEETHSNVVENCGDLAVTDSRVKLSSAEDESIHFYRNNPSLVREELVRLVKNQFSVGKLRRFHKKKNNLRNDDQIDLKNIRSDIQLNSVPIDLQKPRKTDTQINKVNYQRIATRRSQRFEVIPRKDCVEATDKYQLKGECRDEEVTKFVVESTQEVSTEPPDADEGRASVMEHLRQLVYRRYSGPQSPLIKPQQFTSEGDSLSGSLLSSDPDLEEKYRHALEARQEQNRGRGSMSSAAATECHNNHNAEHGSPSIQSSVIVETTSEDFVWRERPVDKTHFQISMNETYSSESTEQICVNTAETIDFSNAVHVKLAPTVRQLLSSNINPVEMARGECILAQEAVGENAKSNNCSPVEENHSNFKVSIANVENRRSVTAQKQDQSATLSDLQTRNSFKVASSPADMNNNNNNDKVDGSKKPEENRRTYSKRKPVVVRVEVPLLKQQLQSENSFSSRQASQPMGELVQVLQKPPISHQRPQSKTATNNNDLSQWRDTRASLTNNKHVITAEDIDMKAVHSSQHLVVAQQSNDGWQYRQQMNGGHMVEVYNQSINNQFIQEAQCWQYEAVPNVVRQADQSFAKFSNSNPQGPVGQVESGGFSSNDRMDYSPCEMEKGNQWSHERNFVAFDGDSSITNSSVQFQGEQMRATTGNRQNGVYNNSVIYVQTNAHHNNPTTNQYPQLSQPQQIQIVDDVPMNGANVSSVSQNYKNETFYANNSARQLLAQPPPSVISIEEALAQLADEDAAMWNEPSITSGQPQATLNFHNNTEGFNITTVPSQQPPSKQSPPAKRSSPLNSINDETTHGDAKKRALMVASGTTDRDPNFPGGEQLRGLIQFDGTISPMTCYGLEVTFPRQVFVVLRNKLNSSAEVLEVNAEPSAARALSALRLPSNMKRPSIGDVQQRFAAFTDATGLPPIYDFNIPDQVDQPKEPRPRRVLALCCAYRLRFPALFFGATTGLENEQDLHDFVHCAAYSGVFNSWNLDQLNAIRKFKELVPPPPPHYYHSVSQTEAFLVIVAHLRVANVPSGRPPPTLRHVVLAPWTAQEINDSLTSLSPAVQASSDALVVFNESRKLNTRTQNVTYCMFFAGVRLLDAAENGGSLSPQQLFDVPVQLSDDGAKVLRKLFSFIYEVYEACGSLDRYAALREARNRLELDDATFFAVLHSRRPVSLIRPRGSYDLSPEHVRRVVLGDGEKSSNRKDSKTPRKSSTSGKPSENGNTKAIAEESCESLLQPATPGTP